MQRFSSLFGRSSFNNRLYCSFRRPDLAFRVVLLIVSVLLLPTLAHAQFRGAIKGTITDPSGAAVAGATVTLTNTQTNFTLTATSDADGIYQFNALPPAPYRLTIEKTGFKKKVLENVQIIPEQPNTLNVQLELGAVQQSVTVSGTTHTLDTETADISGTISSNDIQNMPSFGRDVMQLARLAPGVFGNGAQGSGGGATNLPGTQGPGATGGSQGIFQTENGPQALAVGQQYETNGISIDGISTASAVWGGTTIITPSEDSIQSVKVVANNYDAQYGRFSGAQIQITSQNGTNNFHGSAFFTVHRPGLDAYQRYNGKGNAVLRDNNFFDQFGGSLGGPIWKNKIFAFFDYETVRSPASQASISTGWYETPAFDSSAPAGSIAATYLNFPGSAVQQIGLNNIDCATAGFIEGTNCATIPGQGLDIGSPLTTPLGTQDPGWSNSATNFGLGNGLDGVADIANYTTSSSNNFSKAQYNGRLDADITNNDRVTFAMYYVPQSSNFLNGPARQYNYFHHSQINEAASAIWNHIFSPTLINEFRVNAAGWRWNEVASNPQAPVGLPSDFIDNIGSNNIGISKFGPNVGSILDQWTYDINDVATKVIGRHTINFGGDLTRLFYLQQCAGCGVPSYSFFNIWDFLNDAPHKENGTFSPATGAPTTIRQDDRENLWGFFVQDDFKFSNTLTLNMGLRYSYFSPLRSKENNMYVAFPGSGANYMTDLNVIRRGSAWTAQKDNFSPEIGFAWSPGLLGNKFVLRGGYGLNYNQEEIALSAGIVNNPGLAVSPTFLMSTPSSPNPGIIYAVSSNVHSIYGYPSNPNAVSTFGSNGLPSSGTAVNVDIFPRTMPTMRVHHYSVQGQYLFGKNWIASLGYQGSASRDIIFHENTNALPASLGYTLNPQIGGGDYFSSLGWGNYNAMLAELRHQFSMQFMADAQFTWGKSMDTGSGPYGNFAEQPYVYDLNLNYGPSDYNVSKAFKLYALWQPVIFHGDRAWVEDIVGGWSIGGILTLDSGFPWTPLVSVSGGNLYCGTCYGYNALFPAAYLGGAGTSTSNDAYKTGSDFPNGGSAYFTVPTYTAYSGSAFGNANPQRPGVGRNSFTGPGYRDVDLTLAKAFGFPSTRVLGENAKLEFRMNAYNIFNNLNFNPGSINNNISAGPGDFGRATSALGARVITLGARFSF